MTKLIAKYGTQGVSIIIERLCETIESLANPVKVDLKVARDMASLLQSELETVAKAQSVCSHRWVHPSTSRHPTYCEWCGAKWEPKWGG